MTSPNNRKVLQLLQAYECRNTTFIEEDGTWPIAWEKAVGVHVWDADGKKYLDLSAAFAVANTGHANPRVVRAGQRQMSRLLHAMGDVHPHQGKGLLAQTLSRLTFERWGTGTGKTLFCNSGFEAVEAALKTAHLATGRPNVLAFSGGYHGLGYGALNVTHRSDFRQPFLSQLRRFGTFAPFPRLEQDFKKIKAIAASKKWGAILVEPIQGRGGIQVPPDSFLHFLRDLADRAGACLIFDEIMTGFGRTGKWFACDHEEVVPDVICLGKALTGGFPLSACVGRQPWMDKAWPKSKGEALHTSTFLGHPVGCAMALAQMREIQQLLPDVPKKEKELKMRLQALAAVVPGAEVRGRGLMWGLALRDAHGQPDGTRSLAAIKELLARGFIFLPEGEQGEVIGWTPPLTISIAQIRNACQALEEVLRRKS